jgi:L-fuconolactonase
MIVDAHHHFWRQGESHQAWRQPGQHDVLDRSFRPDDLRAEIHNAAVDRTVLIQSVNTTEENRRLLDYAEHVDYVAGVVSWLPLDDAGKAASMLGAMTGPVRGIRCLIGRDRIDWLLQPSCLDILTELGQRGLAWDVVPVTTEQVRSLIAITEKVPALRIIIDHLGRPPVESGGWQPWADLMRELAAAATVAVKVSVGIDALTAWPEWSAEPLRRYVDWVYAHFGADRMMLASNWPVIELRSGYQRAWADLMNAAQATGMSTQELHEVTGGTATRWYGLPHSGS